MQIRAGSWFFFFLGLQEMQNLHIWLAVVFFTPDGRSDDLRLNVFLCLKLGLAAPSTVFQPRKTILLSGPKN